VRARIGEARVVFNMFKNNWHGGLTKSGHEERYAFSMAMQNLYGSKTWKRGGKKRTPEDPLIQTFINSCLRDIFNILWPEKIHNE